MIILIKYCVDVENYESFRGKEIEFHLLLNLD